MKFSSKDFFIFCEVYFVFEILLCKDLRFVYIDASNLTYRINMCCLKYILGT